MRVVVCDRCGQELQNKRKAVFKRYDTVSVSPQERLDLCEACYPFWDKLHRKLLRSAEQGIEAMEREEKTLLQEFWGEVTNGITQETGGNPAPPSSEGR